MTFVVHSLPAPLSAYVSALYCPAGTMPYPHEKVYPVSTTDLKINFGEPIRAYRPSVADPFAVCKDSWCTGPADEHHEIRWARGGDFVGLTFTLTGTSAILGVPASELHDRVVPLDALWGKFASEARERLYEARTPTARFALLEQLLLRRLCPERTGLRTVRHVLARIATAEPTISVRKLSEGAGISQKHLIALFHRYVGSTPKQVLRVERFRRILDEIAAAPQISWTEVAHDYGYADQSHFNKDFASFTGTTPTEYLALRRRVLAEQPAHATNLRLLSTGSRWRDFAANKSRNSAAHVGRGDASSLPAR